MKAIILAAGRGSRMGAATDDRPKSLLELRGKTLLQGQIDSLSAAGVGEISVVTGYKRELFDSYGLNTFHNARWASSNMVSSLACADEMLRGGPCIISYSDIFYSEDAVRALMDSPADIAITYDPHWLKLWSKRFEDPLEDAETFKLDTQGNLLEIGEVPLAVEDVQGQYMGLLRIAPRGWSEMQRIRATLGQNDRDSLHVTGLLQKVVDAGNINVTAIAYEGEWGEVDNVSDLEVYSS